MDRINQVKNIIAHLRNINPEQVSVEDDYIRVGGIDQGVVEYCGNSVTVHQFDASAATFMLA